MKKLYLLLLTLFIGNVVVSRPIIAEETSPVAPPLQQQPLGKATTDFLPVKTASESDVVIDENNPTDPAVNLTPDKSDLIRLSRKASAVIVGNPAHLNIVPEGLNTLILVPKAPGATYFTVLDEDNKVIMQRHVIVASPKEKYIRISKTCNADAKGCQATQVYYCPDMCHEIKLNTGEDQDSARSAATGAAQEAAQTGNTAAPADSSATETTGQ